MFPASRALDPAYADLSPSQWRQLITDNYQVDEAAYIDELMGLLQHDAATIERITQDATRRVEALRGKAPPNAGLAAFLQEYSLGNQEGVILMCLAEALIRIPDAGIANQLIADRLRIADWDRHLGHSDSWLVNAASWALMLTGKVLNLDDNTSHPATWLRRLTHKAGAPVIRRALNQAMNIMGQQFVLGDTIAAAIRRAQKDQPKGYTHTFDMLGEAALTADDAARYRHSYQTAIQAIGAMPKPTRASRASISVKLSALHPRYEASQRDRLLPEMVTSLTGLALEARRYDVALTLDAEEADRLELSLEIFEAVFKTAELRDWHGLGMAVQAYSKRALPTLGFLRRLAQDYKTPIPVRLVKGAYWDAEIKWSQAAGYAGYPVFTCKAATDLSYLACARFLLANREDLLPQFATHNAQTISSILHMADCLKPGHSEPVPQKPLEFQRLHGMGEALYDVLLAQHPAFSCRVYAPVGAHQALLPYLIRRLLENGANSAFVHQLLDPGTRIEQLVMHPAIILQHHAPQTSPTIANATIANPAIPLPPDLYGKARKNARGINLNIQAEWSPFQQALLAFQNTQWQADPIIAGEQISSAATPLFNPARPHQQIGQVSQTTPALAEKALALAHQAQPAWQDTPAEHRAQCLAQIADLYESHQYELIALCVQEAGKTLQDAIDEVREAVDFCRYYAQICRETFAHPITLPGPTGESNQLLLTGRGVFACISPWNFPLAIFTGQITAALAAGNSVLAKPASHTPLIAWRAIQLMHQAGIPPQVLQFLPGSGAHLSPLLTSDARIAGVAFTGATETAWQINRALAARQAPIAALIAETGGQNAMLVDSSALPEQVVVDVIRSAFTSAGQRCSALRVLFLQTEIADRVIGLLRGAMQALRLGDPSARSTDIGPVISASAQKALQTHLAHLHQHHTFLAASSLPTNADGGYFVAPSLFEINRLADLQQEHFGPILHLVRYQASALDQVIDSINAYGFGLTLGIHTRIESRANDIARRVRVGNLYINRNMIGAVVGVQPFGGQGLSGTGPKAGGPHYLLRFATEKTISRNLAAIGGNVDLLSSSQLKRP